MNKVNLNPCYTWDCSECNKTNYVSGEVVRQEEVSEEDIQEIRESLGLNEWQELPEGVLLKSPSQVVCTGCKIRFEAIYDHDCGWDL